MEDISLARSCRSDTSQSMQRETELIPPPRLQPIVLRMIRGGYPHYPRLVVTARLHPLWKIAATAPRIVLRVAEKRREDIEGRTLAAILPLLRPGNVFVH